MAGQHDKIIASAAKTSLGSIGFRRKGQSRTWLADHGWWATVVEFQPSSWSKGSYLNVAAHWLWSGQNSISFDFGGRIAQYVQFFSDEQFAPEAARLSECAALEAQRLAGLFVSIDAAADILIDEEKRKQDRHSGGWMAYHAGVSAALAGRAKQAADMFTRVANGFAQPNSVLAAQANYMASLDPEQQRQYASSLINSHRTTLRLPALSEAPF